MTIMSEKAFKKSAKTLFNEIGGRMGVTYAQTVQILSKVLFSMPYEEAKVTMLKDSEGQSAIHKAENIADDKEKVVVAIKNGDKKTDMFVNCRHVSSTYNKKYDFDWIIKINEPVNIKPKELFFGLGLDKPSESLLANLTNKASEFIKINGFDYCMDEFNEKWHESISVGVNELGFSFDECINSSIVFLSGGVVGGDPDKTLSVNLHDIIVAKKNNARSWVVKVNYLEDQIDKSDTDENKFLLEFEI